MGELFLTAVALGALVLLLLAFGIGKAIQAVAPEDPSERIKREALAEREVAAALVKYRESRKITTRCPSCKAVIQFDAPAGTETASESVVHSRCTCGLCNGTYRILSNGQVIPSIERTGQSTRHPR